MKRPLLLLLTLLVALALRGQTEDALEQWLAEEGNEEWAAEMSDLMLQLRDEPVNINDTAALATLPFFSPFQLKALRNYMTLYGQLLTVEELRMVPGFDSASLAQLRPLLTARPYVEYERMQWWRGRHTLVSGMGGTLEEPEGYRNGRYEGDRNRALLCYTYKYRNNINFRLSADKDPGEAWGKGNHYAFHLMLKDMGRLKSLVVGRYNLRFGQGVTLWTGMAPFTVTGSMPLRYANGVCAAGPFNEEDWQQGAAATVAVGRGLSLSAFGSRKEGEWLGGSHVEYRHGNLIAGITAVATWLDDSLLLRDYAYNRTHFRGDRLSNIGADFMWQHGRLLLFGEGAVDSDGSPAGIGGLRVSVGGGNSFGLTARYYSPHYHNLHAQAYAVGATAGERGATLDARLQLPLQATALLSADLHRFDALRYGSYKPSAGAWLRAQLSRPLGRHTSVEARYAWRRKERNVPNLDSTLYLSEQTLRQQLQLQLRYQRGAWRLTTRAIAVWFDPERVERQHGWLVAQEVRRTSDRWQLAAQAAVFDIGGYYARIYLSESNLQYHFAIPSLNGRGARLSAVLRCDVTPTLNIGAKYTLSAYPDQEAVGTGDAQTEGPLRQTWNLQVRWKLHGGGG